MANEMKYCRKCGAQVSKNSKFCPDCGSPVSAVQQSEKENTIICPKCGMAITSKTKFCRFCGTGLEGNKASTNNPKVTQSHITSQFAGKTLSAAKTAGEFDYGELNIGNLFHESIRLAKRSVSSGLSDEAFISSKAAEILSPVKSLFSGLVSFGGGILNLIRKPKTAFFPLLFGIIWVSLATVLKEYDSPVIKAVSWLTYAQGGLSQDVGKMIGGLLGKGVVAAAWTSLFTGGFVQIFRGIGSLFKKTENRRSIIMTVIGIILGIGLYFVFSGLDTSLKELSMVGISGAILTLEALGGKSGWLYSFAMSLTSKVKGRVRVAQDGKLNSFLGGITLGFVIITVVTGLR